MKKYYYILFIYFVSFSITLILSLILGKYGIVGFLLGFFCGIAILFFSLLTLIIQNFPSTKFISFNFINKNYYFSYIFISFFYTSALWIDKIIFWAHPDTHVKIYQNLYASIFYDIPIFFAYLTIIPGMGFFFFRLEADFAEKYDLFYNAVREGTLEEIEAYKSMMQESIRNSIRETIFIQGVIILLIVSVAPYIFNKLNLPFILLSIFYICTIGSQLQLGTMNLFTFLLYLDRRLETLILSIIFFILNIGLTYFSIYLGSPFYGYGFTITMLIMFTTSLIILRRIVKDIDYETFMLQ